MMNKKIEKYRNRKCGLRLKKTAVIQQIERQIDCAVAKSQQNIDTIATNKNINV